MSGWLVSQWRMQIWGNGCRATKAGRQHAAKERVVDSHPAVHRWRPGQTRKELLHARGTREFDGWLLGA
jgi:hypothetical protein